MAGYGTSCGACRFLRRKCSDGCIFAPYFCYDEGATHFSAIHKVFGASNVSKLLSHLPIHNRSEAAVTIFYEAQARIRDPIYGCVAHIFALQQQVAHLQEEIDLLAIQTSQPTLNAVDNYATPQAININGFQFSLQQEHTNLHDSLNPISTMNVNCEWAFDGEVGHQWPDFHPETIDRWDHCLLSDIVNGPKSSEKIAVDVMDHVIWPNETCFDSSICPQF